MGRAYRAASRLRLAWLRAQHPSLDADDDVVIERGLNAKFDPTATVSLRGCELRRGVVLRAGPGAELSVASSTLGPYSVLAASKRIAIGDGCAIAEMAVIRDQDHVVDPPRGLAETGLVTDEVRIGDHVWIGSKATVLRGVEIGDHAVVGAGAVVTRSVPPGAVVAGVPARRIR